MVPMIYGIGKGKMLKVLLGGKHSLSLLGDVCRRTVPACTSFISNCYSYIAPSMTDCKIKAWPLYKSYKYQVIVKREIILDLERVPFYPFKSVNNEKIDAGFLWPAQIIFVSNILEA